MPSRIDEFRNDLDNVSKFDVDKIEYPDDFVATGKDLLALFDAAEMVQRYEDCDAEVRAVAMDRLMNAVNKLKAEVGE